MTNMIDNGEEWMLPLLQFRNRLANTQHPDRKGEIRDFKRRDGRVKYKKDGGIIWGPYKLEFRKTLLRELLEVQKKINATPQGRTLELISVSELQEIRRLWILEERDWEDSLPVIVREVLGRDLEWTKDDIGLFKRSDKALLERLCEEEGVPTALATKLLEIERQVQGMSRRASTQAKIRAAFAEDWRTREQAMSGKEGMWSAYSESNRS